MQALIQQAHQFLDKIAIESDGRTYTYEQLLSGSAQAAGKLLNGSDSLEGARIAFMVTPGFDYVKVQWGIWRAGGIAVPLHPGTPLPSVEYVLKDAEAGILIISDQYANQLSELIQHANITVVLVSELTGPQEVLPDVQPDDPALMLYTSGTTGSPKGVVTTHGNIEAQITSLIQAWEWQPDDSIVNILPLHHVHGIINVVSCALWAGATCHFLTKFDPSAIFSLITDRKINVFMAVPTIYYKLISYYETRDARAQQELSDSLAHMRLMVSGSAALPISTLEKWQKISGHVLLERYGMTEIGMAISNPYSGERRPGHIGQPLPGVDVRLVDDNGDVITQGPGEIQVKGPGVFSSYWQKPEATTESFTEDGWFKTGDVAEYNEGSYRILGRKSVDIIKSGGYKISALEIEEVLRQHPAISDCGVVGIPDEEWGEVIGAGLVSQSKLDTKQVQVWLKERLPGYKVPRRYMQLDDLPRNAMGKVTKKELVKLFERL